MRTVRLCGVVLATAAVLMAGGTGAGATAPEPAPVRTSVAAARSG